VDARQPAQANVGVPATGSLPHFFGLMVGEKAKVQTQVIGYRGSAPLLNDLIGGQVPIAVDTEDVVLPQHNAGKLRILALSGAKRSPFAPNIPTFKEAGLDLAATGWNTFFAPATMPKDKVERLASGHPRSHAGPGHAAQVQGLGHDARGQHAGADRRDAEGLQARSGRPWCRSRATSPEPRDLHRKRDMTSRPNIIFIVADDLGFADLGCYGGRDAAFGPVSPVLDGAGRERHEASRRATRIRRCARPRASR
jgi:hypothetical protein